MKQYLILATSLCMLIMLFACNKKTSENARTDQQTEQPPQPDPAGTDPAVAEAYQVIGFQKTACFGKCPVYQVKIYSDGKATWFGKMHVERMGWHDAQVSKEEVKRLLDKAQECGYFDFYNEYPTGDNRVADLPSTISYIRIGDMEKQIKNTHDGPAKLDEFQQFMVGYIESLPWRARAYK